MRAQSSPPRWPLRLLRRLLNPTFVEELEGDLEERFHDNLVKHGPKEARRRHVRGAMKLIRPALVRKLSGDMRLNQYGMFRNYLKTSLRSIRRNALFSTINVVGLAISMSVGILMILFLSEIFAFDQFHEAKSNIYRITTTDQFMGQENQWATASIYIAERVKEQVPAVEEVTVLRMGVQADVKAKNDFVNISGFYATSSFFDIFSFDLLEGDPRTALDEPNSIILTSSTAAKLFGDEEAFGKTLVIESTGGWQNRTISGTVTGVLRDPPMHSHLQFEALVSLSTYDQPASGPGWKTDFRTNPGDFQMNHVYLRLQDDTSKDEVESMLANIMSDYNAGLEHPVAHRLQPLGHLATAESYFNPPGPTFSRQKIYAMVGLTLIVLFSACFNYTNMSLARSLRRMKEVGIRKVTGANRSQVFGQFMVEAVILSVFALVLGVALFYLIKPEFLALPNPTARDRAMFLLDIEMQHVLLFVAFAIIVGCIAGFIPALFLSKLHVLKAFRQRHQVTSPSGVDIKRALTVCQFILSIGLITCAALTYDQYRYAMDYELGYETDNVINVRIKGDYADLLQNEYAKIPEVLQTSRSARIMGWSTIFGMAKSEDEAKEFRFLINEIDHYYLDMHGFHLLAGSNFLPPREGKDQHQVIVNETFLKALEIASPEEALGTHIWHDGVKRQIIGVVEDFITTSLVWELDEKFAFVPMTANDQGILGVKISAHDQLETLFKLEEVFEKVDESQPFEADLYNDLIAIGYREYQSMYSIISFLAFLAISISTLGLLGMAVFTVETRIKEIGIRKILGAGLTGLAALLSRSFLVMIAIASLVAIPVTAYIVDQMLLADFLYRSDFQAIDLLSGLVILLVIALLTVGWQVRMAALRNPADILRDE